LALYDYRDQSLAVGQTEQLGNSVGPLEDVYFRKLKSSFLELAPLGGAVRTSGFDVEPDGFRHDATLPQIAIGRGNPTSAGHTRAADKNPVIATMAIVIAI